ncbi:MAG TPA: LD-carboxypeptidase [Telluria sp.]|nr:LD-carboxypeptidase [Telluria sp.]
MSRRSFGALMTAAALALPASAQAAKVPRKRMKPHTLIKPPRLHQGDTVAIIAPGGRTSNEAIDKAVARVESLGFKVKLGTNLREVHGNYAGTVQQRLDDLHAMFADPDVKGIWCIRGGSGCISLLAHIDYALIRRHPKVLIGYSDITALHLALYRKLGLVTFHGPVASSGIAEYTHRHLMNLITDPQPEYIIAPSMENTVRALTEPHYGIRTVREGVATGRLIGGNLSLVSALAGTPYAADFEGALLYLEEVNEEPYRIDRWMTQLDLSTGFAKAAGVMIGICDNCGPVEGEISLTLDETLDIHLQPLQVPAVTGYSFGHIRNQFTLPIGVNARLDTESETLTLLEPAVA